MLDIKSNKMFCNQLTNVIWELYFKTNENNTMNMIRFHIEMYKENIKKEVIDK